MTCGKCTVEKRLDNKVAIVTGANTGIGYETAADLALRGARVILACRDLNKARLAKDRIVYETGCTNVIYKYLDLSSFRSVRSFAADILESESRLDILINNAGTGKLNNALTEDGIVEEMQINHFGPFLLTTLLLPLLKSSAPSRIIVVSSIMHFLGSVNPETIHKPATSMLRHSQSYSTSKLCNILFTKGLNERLKGTGVTANCLHPGGVDTDIFQNKPVLMRLFIRYFFKSPWEGAQTSIYLAVADEVADVSGKYFVDCKPSTVSATADDPILAERLWHVSMRIVGDPIEGTQ